MSLVLTRLDDRQTRDLQTATSQTLGYVVCDVFVFGGCVVVAFVFSYKLTLVMLATGVPSALVLWAIGRLVDPAIDAQRRELAQAAKHVTAATTAIDLVKVYNGEDHEAFQVMAAIRRSARHYSRQVLCNCAQMGYIKLWMIMLFVLGFYFAVVLVGRGELTPGNALTTFYAVLIAFQSLGTVGPQWLVLAKGMAAGQFLEGLVKEEAASADEATGWRKPSRCAGDIRMSNVSGGRVGRRFSLTDSSRSASRTRPTRQRWSSRRRLCGLRPGSSPSSLEGVVPARARWETSSCGFMHPWPDRSLWTATPSQPSTSTGSAEMSL